MRHLASVVAVVLLTSLFAAGSTPVVLSAIVNYGVTPNQITINGSGFSPKGITPQVVLNNGSLNPLVSFTDSVIVANLVRNQPAGTYTLIITNSQGNFYQMSVTIGAVGPQGPIGRSPGPQGPQGPQGPEGPQGPPGPGVGYVWNVSELSVFNFLGTLVSPGQQLQETEISRMYPGGFTITRVVGVGTGSSFRNSDGVSPCDQGGQFIIRDNAAAVLSIPIANGGQPSYSNFDTGPISIVIPPGNENVTFSLYPAADSSDDNCTNALALPVISGSLGSTQQAGGFMPWSPLNFAISYTVP